MPIIALNDADGEGCLVSQPRIDLAAWFLYLGAGQMCFSTGSSVVMDQRKCLQKLATGSALTLGVVLQAVSPSALAQFTFTPATTLPSGTAAKAPVSFVMPAAKPCDYNALIAALQQRQRDQDAIFAMVNKTYNATTYRQADVGVKSAIQRGKSNQGRLVPLVQCLHKELTTRNSAAPNKRSYRFDDLLMYWNRLKTTLNSAATGAGLQAAAQDWQTQSANDHAVIRVIKTRHGQYVPFKYSKSAFFVPGRGLVTGWVAQTWHAVPQVWTTDKAGPSYAADVAHYKYTNGRWVEIANPNRKNADGSWVVTH